MSDPRRWELTVVGAGAAGLWAAAVAARRGARVLLLEKTPRAGSKILASGGGHCNLTTSLSAGEAARLFRPAGERFLAHALEVLPPAAVRERFHALGVPTVAAALDKVFPESGRARDVCDALLGEARGAGVELRCDAAVRALRPDGDEWRVELDDGALLATQRLVLASGGASYPTLGTTGDGYAWLRELDLPVVEPTPALAPLTSPATWVHELTGVALEEVEVRLVDRAGKLLARRRRPLLFTHQGLSGPAALDVSVHVGRAAGDGLSLRIDLLPALERDALRTRLIDAARAKGTPHLARALPELPRRLVAAVARRVGLPENPATATLDRGTRHRLIESLKGLELPIDGTGGFDVAEVTAGGLALKAVDPRSMQVNAHPGLYVIGELLDLDGPVGGLSFLAAFATAEVAGRALGR